jgi:hypothetical protein
MKYPFNSLIGSIFEDKGSVAEHLPSVLAPPIPLWGPSAAGGGKVYTLLLLRIVFLLFILPTWIFHFLTWIIHGPRLPQMTTLRLFIAILRSTATKDLRWRLHGKTITLHAAKQSEIIAPYNFFMNNSG